MPASGSTATAGAATSVSACQNVRTVLARFLFTTDDAQSIGPFPPTVRQRVGMQILRPKGSQFGFRAVELAHILPDFDFSGLDDFLFDR